MAASLEEIIVGTSLSSYNDYLTAKENYVIPEMFEDKVLSEIFNRIADAYKNNKYNKELGTFDFQYIINDDSNIMQRVVECSGNSDFHIMKWEYNRECLLTGKGNWTDVTFIDYVKTFVNQYIERCKKRNM